MNMNKKLWRMQRVSERMWILAVMMANNAVALGGSAGRGFAVVAEEARKMAEKMQEAIERALFEDGEINKGMMHDIAYMLNLLAVNSTIEAHHWGEKGRQASVHSEEIRVLAYTVSKEMSDERNDKEQKEETEGNRQSYMPYPKNPLSTVKEQQKLILFTIAGIPVMETLINVKEVGRIAEEHNDNRMKLKLRGKELPFINASRILGKPLENSSNSSNEYIIVRTPWAERDEFYAVAADCFNGIMASPVGTPVEPPADMPLAQYVRECWENENGEPFYFMDWTKMAK
jgi:chemotaxis signal transduction protein